MRHLSEITITPDMMRRHRIADIAPRWARDLCGMVATALLMSGALSWAIALTAQCAGGGQ